MTCMAFGNPPIEIAAFYWLLFLGAVALAVAADGAMSCVGVGGAVASGLMLFITNAWTTFLPTYPPPPAEAQMPTRFPSKVDAWLAAVMGLGIVVMVSAGVLLLVAPPEPPALFAAIGVVSLLVATMVAVILLNTHYIIADGKLLIRSGPFRGTVVIADIEKVTPTRNPLSSPACSLDRLNIDYRIGTTRKWVMVSPKDKAGFLRALAEADANLRIEGDGAVRGSK